MKTGFYRAATVLLLGALCISGVFAQTYPSKQVHIVVPFPPGGAIDVLTRDVGQQLARAWGQPVIVDNRPGAGTLIGTQQVARAAADGHTLLMIANSFTINPSVRTSMPYDILKDFTPVTLLVYSSPVLVVAPSLPARTLDDLLALARSRPGQLSFASAGPGTLHHLAFEKLKDMAKVDVVYVPYAADPPAVTALLGGHVSVVMANYASVRPQIEAGNLRAIAVATRERIDALKEVPTISESGFKDYEWTNWFGMMAPAATPRETVARINAEVLRILKLPEMREKLAAKSLDAVGNTPEEFAAFIRSEMTKYAKVAKEGGIKVD